MMMIMTQQTYLLAYKGLNIRQQAEVSIQLLKKYHIHYQEVYEFTQEENEVLSLLKSITKIGAKTSPHKQLNIGDLRKLLKAWPSSLTKTKVKLTWFVQMLVVQK